MELILKDYDKIYDKDLIDLELVGRMKEVDCSVLESGLKEVRAQFYFCNCDP